jgi:hypothetical protein
MISQKAGHIVFDVRVSPGKSINKIKVCGEEISVYIKSPPADGMANRELVRYLSGLLSMPVNRISILRGMTSRNKIIRADGITRDEFLALITKNI